MIPSSKSLLSSIAPAILVASVLAEGNASVELLYRYNEPTWIENIAVRPNRLVLPARATSALLTEFNLSDGNALTLANQSDVANAIMGITEIVPDLFAMNTMECDLKALACTPGTGTIFTIDLRAPTPLLKKIAHGPSPASVLNGMAALNDRTVLLVDQALGGIWAVDIETGTSNLTIQDASMVDPEGHANGVNGIRVRPGVLYFNNPALRMLARIPIDPWTGVKTGEAEIIAREFDPDDFEIDDCNGVAYITEQVTDALLKVDFQTGQYEAVVKDLPGPTSARWARTEGAEGGVLYVSTMGGLKQWIDGNVTIGGAVYKVIL